MFTDAYFSLYTGVTFVGGTRHRQVKHTLREEFCREEILAGRNFGGYKIYIFLAGIYFGGCPE